MHWLVVARDRAGAGLRAQNVEATHRALVALPQFVRHYFFSTGLPQQVSLASAPLVTMNSDLQFVHTNLEPVAAVGMRNLACETNVLPASYNAV